MKYVKLFYDFLDDVEMLTMEERGRLVTAMLLHARQEAVPADLLAGNERYLFPVFRAQLDRDAEAYRQRVEDSRKYAMKRWHPEADGGDGAPAPAHAYPCLPIQDKDKEKEEEEDQDKEEEEGEEKDRASPAPGFVPPAREEVLEYCRKHALRVDGQHFWSYYQSNGWIAGRTPIVDWRAKLRDWEVNRMERTNREAPPPVNPALNYQQREYHASDFDDGFYVDLDRYA